MTSAESVAQQDLCGLVEPSRTPARQALIEAAAAVGDLGTAEQTCKELDAATAALASRWGAAAVQRGRGLIAAARGDTAAEDLLESSAAAFASLGVPLEAARSLHLLGSHRRRSGRRMAARVALSQADALATRAGAHRLAAVATAETRRLAGRRATTATDLTDSEAQVAHMAARGMRNTEVAAALHITPKTVETHLSRIYRKLGVRGRVDLARVIGAKDA